MYEDGLGKTSSIGWIDCWHFRARGQTIDTWLDLVYVEAVRETCSND